MPELERKAVSLAEKGRVAHRERPYRSQRKAVLLIEKGRVALRGYRKRSQSNPIESSKQSTGGT